jgi:hypothetical protein
VEDATLVTYFGQQTKQQQDSVAAAAQEVRNEQELRNWFRYVT